MNPEDASARYPERITDSNMRTGASWHLLAQVGVEAQVGEGRAAEEQRAHERECERIPERRFEQQRP